MDIPPSGQYESKDSGGNLIFVVCLLAAIAVMGTSLLNVPVWDDVYLLGPHLRGEHSGGIEGALTGALFQQSDYLGTPTTYWRPIGKMALVAAEFLFGDFVPGYRLLSLLALLFACFSVCRFSKRALNESKQNASARWVVLLFAIHPFSAEVLGFVINMVDNLVVGFFFLQLSILWDISKGKSLGFLACFTCGLGACFSKELGVATIAAPILIDLFGGHRKRLSSNWKVWVSVATPVVAYIALRSALQAHQSVPLVQGALSHVVVAPANAATLGAYKFLFPIELPSSLHATWTSGAIQWMPVCFLLVICIALVTLWFQRSEFRATVASILVGVCLFVPSTLALMPTDNGIMVPVRYLHAPAAGIWLAMALTVARFFPSSAMRLKSPLLLGLCIILSMLSLSKIGEWRDNLTFWSSETEKNPNVAENWIHLGWQQARLGMHEELITSLKQFDELAAKRGKMPLSDRAQRLSLEAKLAANSEKDYPKAIYLLEQALAISPEHGGYRVGIVESLCLSENKQEAQERVDQWRRTGQLSNNLYDRLKMVLSENCGKN